MAKATIRDVALEAGVSTATISRMLTGATFVSEEVKLRIQVAIEKLNYQPNAIARSLKNNKTMTIGVIIPDISNPFFMSILRGIEDVVHPQGYHLIFCSSDESPEKEAEVLRLLQEKRVDAIVLATSGNNEAMIKSFKRFGPQIILLDRKVEIPGLVFDSVVEDNTLGAYRITQMLLSQGHVKIAVINGHLKTSTGRDRYAGYMKAIQEHGIREEKQLVYDGDFSVEGGTKAVQQFMQAPSKPTAILSFNNNMSFGALLELSRIGLSIPDEMMFASYGEVEAALLLKDSKIIYVQQTPYAIGTSTGMLLLRRLDSNHSSAEPEQIVFEPEIKQIQTL